QTGTIDVYTSFKNLDRVTLDKIKVGDREILPDGTVLAEVLWVGGPRQNYFATHLPGVQAVPDGESYSLPVKMRLRGIIENEGNIIYKMQNMHNISAFTFNPQNYAIRFVIELHLGKQTGTVDVYVSFKNIDKTTLDKINAGDKEVLLDGTVIAEILWVGDPLQNYFATHLYGLSQRSIFAITDGNFYSLPAKLRLRGVIRQSAPFVYKLGDVIDGSFFTFDSGKYAADFVVEAHLFEIYEESDK
ncbi:MAG: hypothetical protein NG740_05675, partial [Omnitrophica bacterium]|nr:hypothetical protein [Candidatus Omnitrophota bacterium]